MRNTEYYTRYFKICKHFLKNPVFFPLSFPFAAFSRVVFPRFCTQKLSFSFFNNVFLKFRLAKMSKIFIMW